MFDRAASFTHHTPHPSLETQMPSSSIRLPPYVVPNFCPQCTARVVNARKARLVNPKRRKRVPFCCAKSKFLGLGDCKWQGWVSPNPVSVGIVLWYHPQERAWYVILETRGINPGLGYEAFVAGFVEPGRTCAETATTELQQEVRVGSKPGDWRYVGQVSPDTTPLLLFTFFAKVMENSRMPKLRPDGRETISARWVRVDQLESHVSLVWPQRVSISMVRRALHRIDPEHFTRLPS